MYFSLLLLHKRVTIEESIMEGNMYSKVSPIRVYVMWLYSAFHQA